jgi:FtsP/CotA-like multicopper oxidase with cupredoxin domain
MRKRLFTGAAAIAAALSLAGAAQASVPVPSDIAVPAGNKPFLVGHASGVQIYTCGSSGWTSAPRANLYDDRGRLIATHFAGPSWQTKDGSTVVGQVEAKVTVDPTAIPWLRLKAASTTPGRLGGTTYIQRIATAGGLSPAAADCSADTLGTVKEVPYTADYVFWKRVGGHCRLD